MSSPRLVVGGVIVDALRAPSRVLAARRSNPPELRGRWEFPGGKVETGERPEDALRRELHEELGIHVTLGNELLTPDSSPWRISDLLEMRLWFAAIASGTPEAKESHDEIRWLDPESLRSVNWLDADIEALDSIFSPYQD